MPHSSLHRSIPSLGAPCCSQRVGFGFLLMPLFLVRLECGVQLLRDLKEQLLSAQVSIGRVFSCCFQQCIDIEFSTRRRNHPSTSDQADESTRPCGPGGSLIPFQVAFKSVFGEVDPSDTNGSQQSEIQKFFSSESQLCSAGGRSDGTSSRFKLSYDFLSTVYHCRWMTPLSKFRSLTYSRCVVLIWGFGVSSDLGNFSTHTDPLL